MLLRMILAGVTLTGMVGAACGGDSAGDIAGTKTVTGLVFDVRADSLTELDGLTLHADDGRTLEFSVAPEADQEDPLNGFVPSHLREHALTAAKVTILYREDGSQLLAIRIDDALT